MAEDKLERRLAAILAADIAGYSRLMGEDEEGTLRDLRAVDEEVLSPQTAQHQGRIFKRMGDGFLAEFPSVVEAVRCALAIQGDMAARAAASPGARKLAFRIGVHLGDVIADRGDVFGDGVNVAARLQALAEPGGICVHRSVRNEVRDRLPVRFVDMGEIEVKNIARPIRAFRVALDGVEAGTRAAPGRKPKFALLAIAAALLAFVGLAVAAFWLSGAPRPDTTDPAGAGKRSIAVLPFANVSGDSEQDYFADGLSDGLITQLTGLSGLFVIARGSVLPYKGKTVSPQTVARDLGVRYVLEGSVRKSQDRLRISANLVEAETAQQIWAKQFDGRLADIFTVQDEVINEIVGALAVELTSAEAAELKRIPTANLEAYDWYLRAEAQSYYVVDATTQGRALAAYDKAIALDPSFADAYAGYARTSAQIWLTVSDQVLSATVARKRAYEAAGKALELDPNNARAFAALAVFQLADGRPDDAIASVRRAAALNPGEAEAKANLALVLAYSGELDEAVSAIAQAMRLNPKPQPGFLQVAGIVHTLAGKYELARTELETVAAAFPASESTREYLAACYAALGQTGEAHKLSDFLTNYPFANLAAFRNLYTGLFRNPSDLARYLSLLAKAGIPEWPLDYRGNEQARIRGEALATLTVGRGWQGITTFKRGETAPFFLQVTKDFRAAYRGANTFLTGLARIENDQLCLQFEASFRGHWQCGAVYADKSAGLDYALVLPDTLRFFSVK
ncbi:adenylate/guanylate cyclase domain-containing protein [Mesorhizobium ventifaucium]|uniref:Adenylate cyclase n=1 Tax=Mesorhizobium ventifaucium TaxID=666020 RepID=A0ABM9DJD1_9HYPH|nr:adenylate/guanylate cyclase domain-containing protein [Mesorhizobium ventifaucium]CAH2396698.1 Adenylate cyclase [Mesorhizobium ventifaucium]